MLYEAYLNFATEDNSYESFFQLSAILCKVKLHHGIPGLDNLLRTNCTILLNAIV